MKSVVRQNFARHLRLLPAVMAVACVLLAMKGAGFAIEARAQESTEQPAASAEAAATTTTPDLADDESESASAAEVDVLTSLSKRRATLDAREQELTTREALIQAAEQRVDGKIGDLKKLQTQIQQLLGQRDEAAQKQLDSLVKTYSSMKPRDAARIFDALNEDVLLAVAGAMKPDVLGAILAAMQPDAAQKLTLKLASKLKLPEPVAMLTPPPAAPDLTQPAAQPAATTPAPAATQAAATAPAAPKPATGG